MKRRLKVGAVITMMVITDSVGSPMQRAGDSTVGPRGAVGPDVPLRGAEQTRLARRVTVEGQTAGAIQAAFDRAAKEGVGVIFLPAGQYEFEKEVRVPSGLTVLGEGAQSRCFTRQRNGHLFRVEGDNVRFTRLKIQGADTSRDPTNDSFGISADGRQNVRVDHCEAIGFSYALNFNGGTTAQVDHCAIHHNARDDLGYGVAIVSGAKVMVCDNEFSQCRHALASNGALQWNTGKDGLYRHVPGAPKTHWEFRHNRVDGDRETLRLAAVDTHPGMDGTFVVENSLFENIRTGVVIRDGAGLIQGNLFRRIDGRAIYVRYTTHHDIPVEDAMPHDVVISDNVFIVVKKSYEVGKAENVTVDGKLVPETRTERKGPPPTIQRLKEVKDE